MAALLIGGSIAAIERIREKRAGKRKSTAASTMDDLSPRVSRDAAASPEQPPPSFSSTNLPQDIEHPPTVAQEKERMRAKDMAAAQREHEDLDDELPSYEHPIHHADDEGPPPIDAPPYARHRSDTLLESSQPRHSRRPSRGLFPRAHTYSTPMTAQLATDAAVSESSSQAREMERQGRTKCVVGRDGRCACGKRARSPGAPLGETVKERRERKWKEKFSWDNPGFWGLVGVSLASHGGVGRFWEDKTQFRYWD